jgi:transposase
MVDRVSEALLPHYDMIGQVARTAPVNYIDETSWLVHGDWYWLWVMANSGVAYFQIHRHRSKVAFAQLIADWQGLLVSDGYSVYQSWQGLRQSCLAHLLRTAKGLAESVEAGIARCDGRLYAELQRLCHMGTERPTVGQWRAWSARFCHEKGNRWVERLLSVRHTYRIRGRPTFPLPVEAVSCLFNGETPDLSWITPHGSLPVCATP